ncbi:ABC transporter permease [Paracoccus saliphilus]|uniref:ABC transporter permease n=1 Tax=Paracoccus saliphilus TaxID=405559 RepID=A0AA45W4L4_9RHOB|nr:ABC transporter permease [Paracoccus saliphilus]WCR04142.1 ABC transporter permease [Paracoccus saliphilus]SIS85544.1 ABC-type polysaccharide/polyol phosphate export permease [Paracoccus saliphilus]
MFATKKNRNFVGATTSVLALIHHQTVYNLRQEHRNALIGLLLSIMQTVVFISVFGLFFVILGVRSSPIRADFMLFLISGVCPFMLHVKCVGAVSSAYKIGNPLMKHRPLTPLVLVMAAALAELYRQTLSVIVLLSIYHVMFNPVHLVDPVGCAAMFVLAWLAGLATGLFFLGISAWAPKGAGLLSTVYRRISMIASGKMMVANALPNAILVFFYWNPLFHIIDQLRGYAFINYNPVKTSYMYAIWFSLVLIVISVLINFATRKYESLSWNAAQ